MGNVRRIAAGALLGGVALVATACPEPAPPTSPRPTFTSAVVSPDPVAAGGEVVATVTAESVSPITSFTLSISAGARQVRRSFCTDERVERSDDGLTETRRLTCDLPADAPNGTWYVQATAWSGGVAGTQAPVEVVGGTDDRTGPELISSAPATRTGGEFTVRFRLQDPHGVHLDLLRLVQGETYVGGPAAGMDIVPVGDGTIEIVAPVHTTATGPLQVEVWATDDYGMGSVSAWTVATA